MNHELGGNIILSNFELDNQEMIVVNKLVGNYAEKIRHFQEYQQLKLEMKTHLKAKNRHFEINALLSYNGKTASSEAQGTNPFVLISQIMEKILNEVQHRTKNK